MTQSSSLPIWAVVYILGLVALFILGYYCPYVPKSCKLKLEQVDKEDWSSPRPTVTIRDRIPPTLAVALSLLVALSAFVLFIIFDSGEIILNFGGGILRAALVYFIAFILYGVASILDIMVYISAETIAMQNIKKHYERHFGANFEHDLR